jgi:hypothetical protein
LWGAKGIDQNIVKKKKGINQKLARKSVQSNLSDKRKWVLTLNKIINIIFVECHWGRKREKKLVVDGES